VSNLFQINLDVSKGLGESFPMLFRMINHFFGGSGN